MSGSDLLPLTGKSVDSRLAVESCRSWEATLAVICPFNVGGFTHVLFN